MKNKNKTKTGGKTFHVNHIYDNEIFLYVRWDAASGRGAERSPMKPIIYESSTSPRFVRGNEIVPIHYIGFAVFRLKDLHTSYIYTLRYRFIHNI